MKLRSWLAVLGSERLGIGIEWVGIGCLEHFLKTHSLVMDPLNFCGNLSFDILSWLSLNVVTLNHPLHHFCTEGFSFGEFLVGSGGLCLGNLCV